MAFRPWRDVPGRTMSIPSHFPPALLADRPLPVVAYLLASTKRQTASIRNQLGSIKRFAANHGMVVVRVFAEVGKRRRGIKR